MAWTKPTTRTAKADVNDVTISLRHDKDNQDFVAYFTIDTDGDGPQPPLVAGTFLGAAVKDGTITQAERDDMLKTLRKLRNAELLKLGFKQA